MQVETATVAVLKQWCGQAGLSKTGRKADLQARLKAVLHAQQGGGARAGTQGKGTAAAAAAAREPLPPVPPGLKSQVAAEQRTRICLTFAKRDWRVTDADLGAWLPGSEANGRHSATAGLPAPLACPPLAVPPTHPASHTLLTRPSQPVCVPIGRNPMVQQRSCLILPLLQNCCPII